MVRSTEWGLWRDSELGYILVVICMEVKRNRGMLGSPTRKQNMGREYCGGRI